jgi:four helix bundle protein
MAKENYTLETLEVYIIAEKLSDEIWALVTKWKPFERDTVGKQLTRAVDSISANIAEGYGRFYYKESKVFYFFARGSLLESKSWIRKSLNRDLIKTETAEKIIEQLELIHTKLNAYIKFVSQSQKHKEQKS